ncbi:MULTISPECIES: hypothetical protein [unclassified Pseudoalteromonas]|uniref:hypothetical protein n=1 Tax=unclassified Pseudoalteromonas TaxID=194690 RepID=UPI0003FDC054|nr:MULTISPECIES: hypothetical protein [unclassified Pseudoalteromonas]
MAMDLELVKKKAEQKLDGILINPLDVLIESPVDRSIITGEDWLGKRCYSSFKKKWNKEKKQLKACDNDFIKECIIAKESADF